MHSTGFAWNRREFKNLVAKPTPAALSIPKLKAPVAKINLVHEF
jgi:hypothetical protein